MITGNPPLTDVFSEHVAPATDVFPGKVALLPPLSPESEFTCRAGAGSEVLQQTGWHSQGI